MDWLTADLQNLGTVALAGGLGAVIGLEREISDKPAGLRTHIFVCAGSALLVLLGDAIVDNFDKNTTSVINADPIRVVQAIIIGISFLGAGTIIQGNDRVEGLTTGASIYLTAAIGIAVAVGSIGLAVGTTLFAVVVLGVVGWFEHRVLGKEHERSLPDQPNDTSHSEQQARRSSKDS